MVYQGQICRVVYKVFGYESMYKYVFQFLFFDKVHNIVTRINDRFCFYNLFLTELFYPIIASQKSALRQKATFVAYLIIPLVPFHFFPFFTRE